MVHSLTGHNQDSRRMYRACRDGYHQYTRARRAPLRYWICLHLYRQHHVPAYQPTNTWNTILGKERIVSEILGCKFHVKDITWLRLAIWRPSKSSSSSAEVTESDLNSPVLADWGSNVSLSDAKPLFIMILVHFRCELVLVNLCKYPRPHEGELRKAEK